MNDVKCTFCEEVKNGVFSQIGKSRVIGKTDNFVVFPTTGGLVENYQLIVPKKHIHCFGELNLQQLRELKELIQWQMEINKKYFNSESSMFEHGSLHPNNPSEKSIVHAHLHVFPNNISLLKDIEKYGFKVVEIDDISDLRQACYDYDNYLYYRDVNGKNYVIVHDGIPSQFLRKVLADTNGIDNWNWREHPLIENIDKNVEFYEANSIRFKK